METEAVKKKSGGFNSPFFRSQIKTANVSFFKEGVVGYLVGPALALLANSVLQNYFNKYMTDVLGISSWCSWFFTWLPVITVVFVVLGNILVGRLMDKMHTPMGKARPLIILAVPIMLVALIILFICTPNITGADYAVAEGSVFDSEFSGRYVSVLVCVAIGYIVWFGLAYPMYFTSHGTMVSVSTREGGKRSLLATLSNAATLGAVGIAQMIIPFFYFWLFPSMTTGTFDKDGNALTVVNAASSYSAWKTFSICLIVVCFIGALLEFYFTRERVTEETLNSGLKTTKVSVPMGKQAKACTSDAYWWIMMVFFLLYQMGGMMKNVSISYYSISHFWNNGVVDQTYGGNLQGTLAIIGAVPTALGMFIAAPIASKLGKVRTIICGAVIAVIGGCIGFIAPYNYGCIVASFVIKALGSTPAMYLSLSLLADVHDHSEAKHGFRSDGFSMMVYGAIMASCSGLATGILNLLITGYDNPAYIDIYNNPAFQNAVMWLFTGGETACYLGILIIMLFMRVERFSARDHDMITERQMAEAVAAGVEFVPAAEKLRQQEAAARAQADEERKAKLKADCEKKGLNFEEEEAKYQELKAAKDQANAIKKAQAAEAKAAKKAAAAEAAAAKRKAAIEKLAASKSLSFEDAEAEYQAAIDAKAAKKAEADRVLYEKEDAKDKEARDNDIRYDYKSTPKLLAKAEKKAAALAAKSEAAQQAAQGGDAKLVAKAAALAEKAADAADMVVYWQGQVELAKQAYEALEGTAA
ncbi:MAG: MFS transporter [Clostridia bacterium]|nr:MFS transporter [Clostridia bacterium]